MKKLKIMAVAVLCFALVLSPISAYADWWGSICDWVEDAAEATGELISDAYEGSWVQSGVNAVGDLYQDSWLQAGVNAIGRGAVFVGGLAVDFVEWELKGLVNGVEAAYNYFFGDPAKDIFKNTVLEFMNGVGTNHGFCWFCPAMDRLFNAMNNIATYTCTQLSKVFLAAMAVGLLFFLAFKIAKAIGSMQPISGGQFIMDLAKPMFKAIVATAFLLSSLSIFSVLISPLLVLSLNLSTIIMEVGGGTGEIISGFQNSELYGQKNKSNLTHVVQQSGHAGQISFNGFCEDLNVAQKVSDAANMETQQSAFTEDVRAALTCNLRTVSGSLMLGMIFGSTFVKASFALGWLKILPLPGMFLLGLLLLLGHLAIYIAFPFKLVDAMMRLAFIAALMPLWIILWVFPATVGYTKKAWDMFVSTCALFVCLSVVIVLVMALMQESIPGREQLVSLMVNDQYEEAIVKMPVSGISLLITLILCIIGVKLLGSASSLASTFVGAMPEIGMGKATGMASVAIAKTGGSLAKTGASKGLEKMGASPEAQRRWGTRLGIGAVTGGYSLWAEGAYRGVRALFGLGKNAVLNRFDEKKAQEAEDQKKPKDPNNPNGNPKDPNNPNGKPDGKPKDPNNPNGNPTVPPVPPVPPVDPKKKPEGTPADPTNPDGKPDVKPDAKPGTKPEGRPDVKPDTKPEDKPVVPPVPPVPPVQSSEELIRKMEETNRKLQEALQNPALHGTGSNPGAMDAMRQLEEQRNQLAAEMARNAQILGEQAKAESNTALNKANEALQKAHEALKPKNN